eukprot:3826486-Rhodomonas_salina.1
MLCLPEPTVPGPVPGTGLSVYRDSYNGCYTVLHVPGYLGTRRLVTSVPGYTCVPGTLVPVPGISEVRRRQA